MPVRKNRTKRHATGTRKKRMKGGGPKLRAWLVKANKYLRKTQAISKLGDAYGSTGLPYAANVKKASSIAKTLGYGNKSRPRRYIGSGLRIAGSGRRMR
jgi:hypothetical protein